MSLKSLINIFDIFAAPSVAPNEEALEFLRRQGNHAENWQNVRFKSDSCLTPEKLWNIVGCYFKGVVVLGEFGCDANKEVGLYNSRFFGPCVIESNCYIWNCSHIENCVIKENCTLISCGKIIGSIFQGLSCISVGPESNSDGTSRKISFTWKSSYEQLCAAALGSIAVISDAENEFRCTIIGSGSKLLQCATIRNVILERNCEITNSTLTSTIVLSPEEERNRTERTAISDSNVTNCIIHSPCTVATYAVIQDSVLFEHSEVSNHACMVQSILGPDAGVSQGECHHSIVGPFTGFHHKSLLIATLWLHGRGNIAYGAMIGANHTSRSNDQECISGEGCWYGLNVAVKLPFNTLRAPYTLIAAGSDCLPQRISFPFSLIRPPDKAPVDGLSPALNVIQPAWILYDNLYFLERAMQKFSSRRRSTQYRTDHAILRPVVMDMVVTARNSLKAFMTANLARHDGKKCFTAAHIDGVGKCVLHWEQVGAGYGGYALLVRRYLLHGVLFALVVRSIDRDNAYLRRCLQRLTVDTSLILTLPSISSSPLEWLFCDMEALYAPAASWDERVKEGHGRRDEVLEKLKAALVTESVAESVLVHQLQLLHRESPELHESLGILFSSAQQEPSERQKALTALSKGLNELLDIEFNVFKQVKASKEKDCVRAAAVFDDYSMRKTRALETTPFIDVAHPQHINFITQENSSPSDVESMQLDGTMQAALQRYLNLQDLLFWILKLV